MKSEIKYPSVQEIEQYHNGTLDAARSHEIERLSLDDPFVADAIDGFQASPYFQAIPDVSQILPSAAGAAAKTSLIIKTWTVISSKWVVGLITTASVITTSIVLYNSSTNSQTQKNNSPQEIQALPNNTLSSEDSSAVNKIIKPDVTPTISTETVTSSSTQSASTSNNEIAPSESTQENQIQEPFFEDETYTYLWVEMKYVKGHHVLDYSDVYNKDYPHPDRILAGEKTSSSDTLSYLAFLELLLNVIDDKKYNDAEKLCTWMNKKQSADINATFYGAMCAFYLGKYDDAKIGFKKITSGTAMAHRRDSKKFLAKIQAIETNSKEK